MADPGFFQMGAPNPRGVPMYFFDFFCRKLHENGRNWSPGGVRPWRPLGSANAFLSVISVMDLHREI